MSTPLPISSSSSPAASRTGRRAGVASRLLGTLLLLLGWHSAAWAQLTGTKAIPGDYATVAAAITDLNTAGVGAGGVTFNIAAGYTETAANLTITATGTSANPIVFQKSGTGANPLLTAGVGTSTSSDGVIRLSGADYVTFNGIDVAENSANTTATTQMEFGYALFRASATDGCQNNTIRNCVVTLNKTNTATIGIAGLSFTTAATTALAATSPAGANSGNKVYGNVVTNTLTGINFAAASATTTANLDQNNEIGVTAGNTIGNFGGTASGWGAGGGYQNGLKISGNIINSTLNYTSATASTAVAASTVTSTLRGIYGNTGTSSNIDITNNTITLASGGTTSQMSGIENSIGSTAAGNTVNITGNTVQNCSYTTATTATFYGLYNTASAATVNITGNTLSNTSLTGTGTMTLLAGGGPTTLNISTNTLTGNTRTATGTTAAVTLNCITAGTAAVTVANNVVSNNGIVTAGTSTTAGTIYGYYNASAPTAENITGNTFTNLSVSGTTTSTSGTIYGIFDNPTSTTTKNWSQNVLGGFSMVGGGIVYGIYNGTGATIDITRNKVYDLSATGSASLVYGLFTNSGTTITLANNLIGDLRAPAATGLTAVNGVYLSGGTTINAYYNSVYLNATSTGATFGTSGIYFSSTPTTVNLRNNLVVNKSTAVGTGGYTVALRRSTGTAGTAPANLASTSNANIYYAGAPSTANLIYVEGTTTATNAAQSLGDYKTLVSAREANSQTEDTPFLSTVGTAATFLHINPAQPTFAEGGAQAISGITTDYDGDTRNTTTPDIGADEGSFTTAGSAIDVASLGLAMPGTTGCYGSAEAIAVTIQNSGIAPLNFATTPVTITVSVTGAVTQTLTTTLNTGTLAVGTSQAVSVGTLNMSTAGTYSFAIVTTVAGDGNTSNNNSSATRTVIGSLVLPLATVEFTGFTGANLSTVYPGWYEATGATVPAGTTSAWNTATGVGGTGNATARINLFTNTRNEWIVGPKFTASAASQLKFRAAITDFASTTAADGVGMTGTDDAVRVLVSTDCGVTFTEVFQVNSTNQPSPTAIAFSDYTVSLASYAGQAIIVAFKATDGPVTNTPDYDFHLDDIQVSDAASSDVGITALVEPGTAGCFSATQNVSVTIRNFGLAAQTNIPVRVVVGGPVTQTLTGTFTGSIAPNATATFTVGQINMLAAGTYTFDAATTLTGDGNAANDALAQQTRTKAALATIPQQLNFTGYTGANLTTLYPGWYEASGATVPAGTTSTWVSDDFGNVTSGPNGISAKVNLYNTSHNDWIIGPRVLATASTTLSYDLALATFATTTSATLGSDDRLDVRVSTDCGVTFTTVKSYSASTPISNTGQSEQVSLGNYAGQEIIVAFFATDGTVDDTPDNDLFLDNISLSNPPAVDLAPTALAAPASGQGCYSTAETVSVTVRNLGIQPLDFSVNPATVTVNVTGAVTQTLTATVSTGTLAVGATQTVTLTPTLDMSTAGTYTFAITATAQGDGNTTNDVLATPATRTVTAPVAGTVTPATSSFCQSGTVTLTLTGSANGSIQWQQSSDNVTFTNIGGATSATYTSGTLTSTTYFRALTTCNAAVATSNVATITNSAPTQSVTAPATACVSAPFTIAVASNSTAGAVTGSQAPNASIPDASLVGVSSTITVAGAPATATISDASTVRVTLNIAHTYDADLDVFLVGPGNTGTLLLTTDNGTSGANYTNTVLTTAATNVIGTTGNNTAPFTGTYAPEGATATAPVLTGATGSGTYTLPAAALNGTAINGDWKLYVYDDASGDTGTLLNWSLSIADPSIPVTTVTGPGTISAPTVSGTTSTFTVTGAPVGSNVYSIVTSGTSGCTTSATQTVDVTALPTATLASATAQVCAGTTYQLAGSVGGSATAGTYTTSGTGTFAPNATTLNAVYTPSAADIAAGSVTITLTAATPAGSTCSAATAQTVLTINPATTATFSYAAAAYCLGGTNPTATVTGTTGGTFSSTAGLTIDATTGTINLATSTAGTYTVTYAVGGTCPSSATATVTLNPATSATFSYASTTLCVSGTAATPTITGTTGGTFSSTTGLTINATTGVITPATSTPGTYTVTYAVSGACSSSATATVTITSAPVATFSYANASYCQSTAGTAAPAFATGASAGTFTSTTGLVINATTGVINLATSSPGTYTVTNTIAASGGCAAATATFSVTINATPPRPTFTAATVGTTTTLTSSSTTGNQWYLNGVIIPGATGQTYVVNSAPQYGSYTVVVTSAQGCPSLPSLPLVVTSSVKPLAGSSLTLFPNPTTDGMVTVKLEGYVKATELTLYNSVGQLVQRINVAGSAGTRETTLDLSQLAKGVYMLRAKTEGGLDVRRIVKE